MKRSLLLAVIAGSALASGGIGLVVARADSVELQFLFSVSAYAPGKTFLSPQGLAFDPVHSELYVADTGNNQVVVFAKNGVPVDRFRHWVRDSEGKRIPGEPYGILPAEGSGLWIVDSLSDEVDLADPRGAPVYTIKVSAMLDRSLRAGPGKMERDSKGNVYLVERTTGRILVLDAGGTLLRSFGTRGKGEGKFEMIADVAVGGDGTIYVLDTTGIPAVQAFDPQGRRLSGFGRHSNKPEDFHFPVALTVDAAGRLWVADAFSHEVKAYTSSGELLGAFGEIGNAPGQFYFPSDLVASPDGVLYVLEKTGRRFQAFRILGAAPPSGAAAEPGKEVHPLRLAGLYRDPVVEDLQTQGGVKIK